MRMSTIRFTTNRIRHDHALLLGGILALLAFTAPLSVWALDSTGASRPEVITSQSVFPVGYVAISPTGTVPPGWLPCNGQPVPAEYSELRAAIGPTVPNYNGERQFLRGTTSGAGTKVAESTRTHSHWVPEHSHGFNLGLHSTGVTGALANSAVTGNLTSGAVTGNLVNGAVNGNLVSGAVSGTTQNPTISLDEYINVATISGGPGLPCFSTSYGQENEGFTICKGGSVPSGVSMGTTSGSFSASLPNTSVTGNLSNTNVTGKLSNTSVTGKIANTYVTGSVSDGAVVGSIYAQPRTQTEAHGGTETAPNHILVTYIIKHD